MQVTSLSIRPLMGVLVLIVAQIDFRCLAQEVDFPLISPDRQQFYEYESFHISCEGFGEAGEWRVMQKLHKKMAQNSSDCSLPAPSCTIDLAFKSHSGEYWCENVEGNTSQSINITVTAGLVILEVPVRPVFEGSDLTFHCRNKKSPSKHTADLYRDGVHLGTMYGGIMTISNVSKSHMGNYYCKTFTGEQSPKSWLSVVKKSNKSIDKIEPTDEIEPPEGPSHHPPLLLWIVVGGVSAVVTLLLAMGLFLCQKNKAPREEINSAVTEITYADVKHRQGNMVLGGDDAVDSTDVTDAHVETQRKKKDKKKSSTRANPSSPEDGITYSSVVRKPPAQDS